MDFWSQVNSITHLTSLQPAQKRQPFLEIFFHSVPFPCVDGFFQSKKEFLFLFFKLSFALPFRSVVLFIFICFYLFIYLTPVYFRQRGCKVWLFRRDNCFHGWTEIKKIKKRTPLTLFDGLALFSRLETAVVLLGIAGPISSWIIVQRRRRGLLKTLEKRVEVLFASLSQAMEAFSDGERGFSFIVHIFFQWTARRWWLANYRRSF